MGDKTGSWGIETHQLTQPGQSPAPASFSVVFYPRDGALMVPLRRGRAVVVGRTEPADVKIADGSLSRSHARFSLLDDGIVVEDLGSTNGTWIKGETIKAEVLRPGDVVVLGAVTGVVHSSGERSALGLDGHDRFLGALEREVVRANHFRRPVSVAMLRAADRKVPVHAWVSPVVERLRPIDQVATFGAGRLEVLMPEADEREATQLMRALLEGRTPLLVGVSSFPSAATSADLLVETSRDALGMATPDRPLRVAASRVVTSRSPDVEGAGIVAQSTATRELLELARKVARGHIPVYLHGETGVGKEVMARFIHQNGPRKDQPMVTVNCAAIPAQLVESTLFGHGKGAFTGANQAHAGVFEAAEGGVVFLDEIGELPAAAQAALLRVLENRTVTRVGSTKETAVDVRVVAASHRDLSQMVEAGSFREDLLYRLNAITVEIPPLRDRREDILPLATKFLAEAGTQNGRTMQGLAPEVEKALRDYEWPGNVRQLRNVIARAVIIAEHDVIRLRDLPGDLSAGPTATGESGGSEAGASAAAPEKASTGDSPRHPDESFRACIERVETEMLLEALEATDGNQSEAARMLDMPRRTLVHKLKTLGIKKGRFTAN